MAKHTCPKSADTKLQPSESAGLTLSGTARATATPDKISQTTFDHLLNQLNQLNQWIGNVRNRVVRVVDEKLRCMHRFDQAFPIHDALRHKLSCAHYRLLTKLFVSRYKMVLPSENDMRAELKRDAKEICLAMKLKVVG